MSDLVQLKIMVSEDEKKLWQLKTKLDGVTLTDKIKELMNEWATGGKTLSEAEKEKLEQKAWEEEQEFMELMEDADAWPVGVPRKVEHKEIREKGISPNVTWIDEVGNMFDKDMSLLTKDGRRDNRQGGGGLLWSLTWEPAILGGWRPRDDDTSFHTEKRWRHAVGRMRESGKVPRDFDSSRNVVREEGENNAN